MAPRREGSKGGTKPSKIPEKIPGRSKPVSGNHGRDSESEDESTEPGGLEQIIAKLDSLELKIESEVKSVKKVVDEGIKANEFNARQLEDKLTQHEGDCKRDREKVAAAVTATDNLTTRVKFQGFRMSDIERKIEELERDRRRNLLLIEGVQEEEGESVAEIVDRLFIDLKVSFDTSVCDRLFRRGKRSQGTGDRRAGNGNRAGTAAAQGVNNVAGAQRNNRGDAAFTRRPIVIGFVKQVHKAEFFSHLSNLRNSDKWAGVYFTDDYTEIQRNQIRDLRALASFARSAGHVATVKGHFLIVDGSKYLYSELHKLGPELTLEKAKTLEIWEGRAVAFQSAHSPLSNLYPCNVSYRGRKFLSSEAALQHTRATICRRVKEAEEIEGERNAYRVKDVGHRCGTSPEWARMEQEVMGEILLEKFMTNPHCRDVLLATAGKKLLEATGDKKWGCGVHLSRIQGLTDPPPGENLLGKHL